MPDVVGKKLDVALSDVERAGFEDDVEVIGGGMFGVLDESNWTVCEQEPAAGASVSSAPRVTVDRVCESNATAEPTAEPTPEPTAEPTPEPTPEPTAEPTESELPAPPVDGVLTTDNNADLMALLEADDDYSLNQAFAKDYSGRKIAFNGSVADATPGYYLVYFGDDSDTNATSGPAFQFRVQSLQADGSPVATGDNLRLVAEVGAFNPDQGLFFLTPVKVTAR